MDTIIYLYHSRETEKFIIEKWQEKEYCLIRLGISISLWKNLKVLEQFSEVQNKESTDVKKIESLHEDAIEVERKSADGKRVRKRWFDKRKRKRQKLKKASQAEWAEQGEPSAQEQQAVREMREERLRKEAEQQRLQKVIQPLLAELSDLQTALCILGDNPDWTYCVYEDFLREKIDTKLWWDHWRVPEFAEYHEWIWAEELMQYATKDSFLILGCVPCVGTILNRYVAKMRSVKWIMKPEQYTEAVQEFVEAFYQENGLVISVQLLGESEAWIRFRPCTVTAVNVLDFTGEEKLSACDVAKGSIWFDMDSLEGKERRIENRCPQITYISLKKHWKQLQKAPFALTL